MPRTVRPHRWLFPIQSIWLPLTEPTVLLLTPLLRWIAMTPLPCSWTSLWSVWFVLTILTIRAPFRLTLLMAVVPVIVFVAAFPVGATVILGLLLSLGG